MTRLSDNKSRKATRLLKNFLGIGSKTFTAVSSKEKPLKTPSREPTTDRSYESSQFSSQCNEEEMRQASRELDRAMRKQTSQRVEIRSTAPALVVSSNRPYAGGPESVESADEEIDISGPVAVEKVRTWEVRNVRMYREGWPMEEKRKKSFPSLFRRKSTRF